MLSDASAATVRATLPAVGSAIGRITDLFYRRLFAGHPELLRDLFNRGNQASGTQAQALAGSVAAFAGQLLERPGHRPDAMLARIAHKHASLGVTPAQYQIVHDHLMGAVGEVLGDAVTPEVGAAWDEVYWLMANALIDLERRLTADRGVLPGGSWDAWEVVERMEETPLVATFLLRPADGGVPHRFRAGQYVSVRVELPDGARQIRQYSLSGAPHDTLRRISVKRETGGAGHPAGEVSNHLHDSVRAGDHLQLSAPYGDLVLEGIQGRPLLLASAGVGVTPMLSMLHELAEAGHAAPVTVVHADRGPGEHALREEHTDLAGKLGTSHFWYEHPGPDHPAELTGRVDLSGTEIDPRVRAYLCGPLPFMREVRGQLLAKGVPAAEIRYEVFGPDLWLARG